MSNCSVSFSLFENHHAPLNGGAICVSSVVINIICCEFRNNSVPQNGGSVYCEFSQAQIYKSTFFKSFSSGHNEGKYGNAVYISEGKAILENNQIYKSSYSETLCSDSSLMITSSIGNIKYLNSTNNYGYSGSAAFSFNNAEEGSNVMYANVVDGIDDYILETSSAIITVDNTNFLNLTNSYKGIIYMNENFLFTFNYCVFWNTGTKIFCSENFNIKCNNCISDRTFGNPIKTETSDIETVQIIIQFHCNSIYNETINNINSNSLLIHISELFTIIVVKL